MTKCEKKRYKIPKWLLNYLPLEFKEKLEGKERRIKIQHEIRITHQKEENEDATD